MVMGKTKLKCPECSGVGYIENRRNSNESVVLKCSRCNGKGIIKSDKPILHETILGDDYRLAFYEGL